MNRDVKKIVKKLKKLSTNGVSIQMKNHLKVKWEMLDKDGNEKKFFYVIPKTPSDHRSLKNTIAGLNRSFKENNVMATV